MALLNYIEQKRLLELLQQPLESPTWSKIVEQERGLKNQMGESGFCLLSLLFWFVVCHMYATPFAQNFGVSTSALWWFLGYFCVPIGVIGVGLGIYSAIKYSFVRHKMKLYIENGVSTEHGKITTQLQEIKTLLGRASDAELKLLRQHSKLSAPAQELLDGVIAERERSAAPFDEELKVVRDLKVEQQLCTLSAQNSPMALKI